ncbi:hypothetical protein FRC12_009387 [Ceratobasidium sp. 428]|nr:hypothetical protein FRC12_009387 [Ceratobasidium sp. 428]
MSMCDQTKTHAAPMLGGNIVDGNTLSNNTFGDNIFGGNTFGSNMFGHHMFGSNTFGGNTFGGNMFDGNMFNGNTFHGNMFIGNTFGGSMFTNNALSNNALGNDTYGDNGLGVPAGNAGHVPDTSGELPTPLTPINRDSAHFANAPSTPRAGGQNRSLACNSPPIPEEYRVVVLRHDSSPGLNLYSSPTYSTALHPYIPSLPNVSSAPSTPRSPVTPRHQKNRFQVNTLESMAARLKSPQLCRTLQLTRPITPSTTSVNTRLWNPPAVVHGLHPLPRRR